MTVAINQSRQAVRKRIEASRRRIANARIREKQRIAALVEKEKSAQRRALIDAARGSHETDAGVMANRATNGRNSDKTDRTVRVDPRTATANRSENHPVTQADPHHSAIISDFAETASADLIRLPLEDQPNTQHDDPKPAHFSYARALSEQLQAIADGDTDFAGQPQATDPETHYAIDYKQVPPEATSRKRFIAGAATATLALASVGAMLAYDRFSGLPQVFAAARQEPAISQQVAPQQVAPQTAQQAVVSTEYSEFSMRISDRIGTVSAGAESPHSVAQLR